MKRRSPELIEQMTCKKGLTFYQRVNYFAEKSNDEKKSSCKQSECERVTGWGEKLNVNAALRFSLEESAMGYFIPSWGSPQDAWGIRHAVNETRARMRAN